MAVAAAISFPLVWVIGDRYLAVSGRLDYTRLSTVVLAGLGIVAYQFGGPVGVLAFVVAAALGLVPPRFGAKRAHLMGVLMVPIMMST